MDQPASCSIHPRPSASRWTRSAAKRHFDVAVVLITLPLTLPILLATAAAVRFTSVGPVLFRQRRIGLHNRPFTIYKFRTMAAGAQPPALPAFSARPLFTPIGPFLRHAKLDELPQLFNVLLGNMSLVGPRPKLSHLHSGTLACRPGITGRATLVFAREEAQLFSLSPAEAAAHYHHVIRPLKQTLDDEYMAGATFASDLALIVRSILRLWHTEGSSAASANVPTGSLPV